MEKVWEIKNPEEYLGKKSSVKRDAPPPREDKDPAAAYSRSMLAWGLGQLYNDQLVKGAVFLVAMVLMCFGAVLGTIYRDEIYDFLVGRSISRSRVFLAAELALFLTILFWISNAADAYRSAARTRKVRFRGVSSRITPFLGSLVVPGWGQFLNGQPIKGSLFSVLTVITGFSVLSVLFTYLAWPLLDAGDDRFIAEGISAACLFLVPLAPLLWTISAYDAFKVSREELFKEPLWERIKAAYYRGRTQGWVRGVFPQIKGTFLLVLFLTFLLLVDRYLISTSFYISMLSSLRAALTNRGMTIMPELIGRLFEAMGWK
jgi:TM2 domain-containing membrane protein YozV